jgi:hypothetical protein
MRLKPWSMVNYNRNFNKITLKQNKSASLGAQTVSYGEAYNYRIIHYFPISKLCPSLCHKVKSSRNGSISKKLKLSHYTPWRRLVGEEVQLLLILDFGIRWG